MGNNATGSVYKVSVLGNQVGGGACNNVFMLELQNGAYGEPSDTALLDVIEVYLGQLWDLMKDRIPNETTWQRFNVVQLRSGTGSPLPDSRPLGERAINEVGNNGTDPLPAGVSALVGGVTAGLGHVLRKFWPGFAEDTCLGQLWSTSGLAALAAVAARLVQGLTLSGGQRLWMAVFDVVANTLYRLVSAYAAAVPAYQRRRKTGSGS